MTMSKMFNFCNFEIITYKSSSNPGVSIIVNGWSGKEVRILIRGHPQRTSASGEEGLTDLVRFTWDQGEGAK